MVSLVGDRTIFEPPVVITNFDYRFRVAEQLKEIGAEATILLEPERRDSAAAVGATAVWADGRDPKTIVAFLAADHVFKEGAKFAALCAQASLAAQAGEIVTFGMTPDHPATGYGYIHPAEPLAITDRNELPNYSPRALPLISLQLLRGRARVGEVRYPVEVTSTRASHELVL